MADSRRTLAVVCFALGTWIGGMFTAACCRHLAAKGYPITTVTPGNNRDEILRVVQALGPQFDQTVLLGYPPFLKDVIDHGRASGVDRSEEHTSELQSLMRISYAVFCLKKKITTLIMQIHNIVLETHIHYTNRTHYITLS